MPISRWLSTLAGLMILSGCAGLSSEPSQSVQSQPQDSTGQDSTASNRFVQSQIRLPLEGRYGLEQVLTAYAQQHYANAMEALEPLLELCPECSNLYVLKGDIHQAEEKQDLAGQAWLMAVGVNPHNYQAHNRLGQWYREQGQFDTALEHYQQALYAWPDFPSAYLNRGILHDLYTGNKTAAMADFQRYLALMQAQNPNFSETDTGRQLARWQAELSRQLADSAPASISSAAPGGN